MLKKNLKIVFRCDASKDIGLGHLMRNLAVAEELKKNNQIIFASIRDPTNSYIKNNHLKIFFKKQKEKEEEFLNRIKTTLEPDILVIDKKYPYSSAGLSILKQRKIKIVMMDNICEGMRVVDEIIFPNGHLDKNLLREFLSPRQINNVKTGPEYVILRDEILALKNQVKHSHTPPNVIVTTGGTDPEGILLKLIPWLKEMNLEANILILIGKPFKFKKELEKIIKNLPSNLYVLPYSPTELLNADIAISTFGVSIYEAIYLKIPTISIAHTLENASGSKILEKRYRVIKNMGYIENINPQCLYKAIIKLLKDKIYYRNMINKCNNLIDEKGVQRVADIIVGK